MKEAKAWSTGAFQVGPYFDKPFYIGFDIGGYALGQQPENHLMAKSENVVTYWGVENVGEAFEQLPNAGASIHDNPTDVVGGIIIASVGPTCSG